MTWTGDNSLRSFYRQRKVLVVGADGFLGVNCVHALQALGAEVSILSRRPNPRAGEVSGQVFKGDLRDESLMPSAVQGQSVVFDFAGISGAAESNQFPFRDLEENCAAHISLLQACAQAAPPTTLMFCSSRLVYGKPRYLPVDETHPLSPESVYAVHKVTVENYLRVFAHEYGLPFCILRLSNPFGPHQPPEARGYGVINQFIRAASEGEPIRIYGDGTQLRDYVFVDEVIAAFLLCAMTPECRGETFNLGGRGSIRLIDAAHLIARLAGGTPVSLVPWPENYRLVETGDYRSNMEKLDRVVRLPAAISFEEGVQRTLQYYRSLRAAVSDQRCDGGCP